MLYVVIRLIVFTLDGDSKIEAVFWIIFKIYSLGLTKGWGKIAIVVLTEKTC